MSGKFLIPGLAVTLFLACASPAMVRAQDTQGAGQEQAAPAQNAPAGPDLNLTDDQKAQMKKIHEDAKSQIDAVNSDSSLNTGQKQAKIQQIHRATHKQVEAILTPSQKETMKEWRIAHKGGRPQ
jgi:Spy/CpxP family protein refolding chaperone